MRNWKRTVNSIKFNHEEIIRKSHAMIISDEVLLKLQESYALEMITASESSLLSSSTMHNQQSAHNALGNSSVNGNKYANSPSVASKASSLISTLIGSPEPDASNHGLDASESRPAKESWLDRYGHSRVSDEAATDMLRVRDDLRNLELQVDVDKKLIQAKILKACESHRDAQVRFDAARRSLWPADNY
jgi:hypothetical protein